MVFVPQSLMDKAFGDLYTYYFKKITGKDLWSGFIVYYEKQWLKDERMKAMINYFSSALLRTNNSVENWNKQFQQLVQTKSGSILLIIQALKVDDLLSRKDLIDSNSLLLGTGEVVAKKKKTRANQFTDYLLTLHSTFESNPNMSLVVFVKSIAEQLTLLQ